MALTSAALLPLFNEWRQPDTNADAELTAYRAARMAPTSVVLLPRSTNEGTLTTNDHASNSDHR